MSLKYQIIRNAYYLLEISSKFHRRGNFFNKYHSTLHDDAEIIKFVKETIGQPK